ncbi:hypothetical protein C7B76_19755 [filamentous cyanobacterium CCP2]|nr:hypothetical protein C7B76_19755 [filamentous cyanobacterium CCP2]
MFEKLGKFQGIHRVTLVLPVLAEPLQGRIAILNRVTRLIEGYESPYSLEVLAIAHWVMQADPQAAVSVERAIPAEGFPTLRLKSGN